MSHRRGPMVVGSAALVVLAVAGCALAACSSDETVPEVKRGRPKPVGERLDLSAPGMHEVPGPPLEARYDGVRVWTGDELVVWGGQTQEIDLEPGRLLSDGATLDLDDGR